MKKTNYKKIMRHIQQIKKQVDLLEDFILDESIIPEEKNKIENFFKENNGIDLTITELTGKLYPKLKPSGEEFNKLFFDKEMIVRRACGELIDDNKLIKHIEREDGIFSWKWNNELNYSFEKFQKDLKEFLKKSKAKPYYLEDEGWIYIDTIKDVEPPKENRAEFIVWLSLFVMIDLVFYTYFRKHYLKLKKEWNTPKFQFGLLSQSYIYPGIVLIKTRRRTHSDLIQKAFYQIVPEFKKELNKFIKDTDLTMKEISKAILNDKDLTDGWFGWLLINSYADNPEEYFESFTDPKLGVKVYRRKM